jgi:CheY-like chemotaxis protein
MHLPAESYARTTNGARPESVRPVIFVVEDEEDIARLISHNLQAAGFEVQSFVSGASVLTEAMREAPTLFLLDVMLPGSDGFELCRHIRQTPGAFGNPYHFPYRQNFRSGPG